MHHFPFDFIYGKWMFAYLPFALLLPGVAFLFWVPAPLLQRQPTDLHRPPLRSDGLRFQDLEFG